MLTCERTKRHNGSEGIKSKCGKKAEHQQEDGLPLCIHHFNKWFKKKYKQSYKEFMAGE